MQITFEDTQGNFSIQFGDYALAGDSTDETARAAAAAAQSDVDALTDAVIGDKAFSNPPSDLTEPEKSAVRTAIGSGTGTGTAIPKATNALVDAESDDTNYMTVLKTFRAIARRVKNASETVRGIVLIARNDDVDNETDLTRVPNLTKSIRLWRRLRTELNEVPDTPGTQSGIGHVLTVISTADKGYAFRALPSAIMNFVQRVLVDVPASDDTVDKIIVEDSQLYTTKDQIVHQSTPKSATYDSVSFDLGYFGDESALDANFYVVGRYYYNFTKHTPRVVAYIAGNSGPKHWVDADAANLVANITADVGYFGNDAEATPHIAAVGNVYYNETIRTYRRAKTFVAGAGPVIAKQRLRQANEDDVARLESSIDTLQDTIILELHPAVVYGGNSTDIQGTYHLNVQTPTPIPAVVRHEISISGQRVSNAGFSTSDTQQTIQFAIGQTVAQNLVNNNRLVIGTTVRITLILFAAGNVELMRRNMDIPIVAKPADSSSSSSYTLPQATEVALGGVRGATSAQATAGSGTVILGWTLNRLKQVVSNNIPAASTSVRGGANAISQAILDAGSSTANYVWNIANVLRAARSVVATWAIKNDVSTIPAAKLGSGARDNTKFLRDDGTWQAVASAGGADATARAAAAANMIVLNRLSVFENYDLNPAGISGNDFPESIALTLTTKLTDKTITRLRVSMRGQIVANVNTPTNLTPFNNAVVEICGGIVNLSLDATTRENLKQNVGSAPQFIEMSVDYTFSDESTANDRLHFGVNNNAFTSYDLREDGSTSATPVAGDRFFFTDENQPGDPVRYVQYRDLEAAFRKFVPQPLFSGNYQFRFAVHSNRFQKISDTVWPEDAEYLMVSLNPADRFTHHSEEGHVIRNPRKGRYAGDTTPTTAVVHNTDTASSGDDKGIGILYWNATRERMWGVMLGRDSRNRMMIAVSDPNGAAVQHDDIFSPIVIQKL